MKVESWREIKNVQTRYLRPRVQLDLAVAADDQASPRLFCLRATELSSSEKLICAGRGVCAGRLKLPRYWAVGRPFLTSHFPPLMLIVLPLNHTSYFVPSSHCRCGCLLLQSMVKLIPLS